MVSPGRFEEFKRLRANPTTSEIQAEFKRRRGVVDLDPEAVIPAFQRARRRALALAAFAGLPVAFAFTGWLDVFSSGVVVISGLIAFFLLLWLLYRCPQCGELPMTDWEVRGLSANQYLDLDPRECRKCGARLK